MASIFSRIVAGEIPCYKIAENERYFAFLDISPLTPGHTLVIPKREVDYLFDLDDVEIAEISQCLADFDATARVRRGKRLGCLSFPAAAGVRRCRRRGARICRT